MKHQRETQDDHNQMKVRAWAAEDALAKRNASQEMLIRRKRGRRVWGQFIAFGAASTHVPNTTAATDTSDIPQNDIGKYWGFVLLFQR